MGPVPAKSTWPALAGAPGALVEFFDLGPSKIGEDGGWSSEGVHEQKFWH